MGLTSFIQRDVVQYILPTVIALGLFLPLLNESAGVDQIVFGGTLIGYFIANFVLFIGQLIVIRLPICLHLPYARLIQEPREEREWWSRNFDYDSLWYLLTKDDREFLYGTQAYHNFWLAVSFYLLVYALMNLSFVVHTLTMKWPPLSGLTLWFFWCAVISVKTSIIFNCKVPSLLLAMTAFVLMIYNINSMIIEFKSLFGNPGQYVTLARLYHKREGGIAKSIWGWVLDGDGKPVAGAQLSLTDRAGNWASTARTDKQGRWQVVGAYKRAPLRTLHVSVKLRSKPWESNLVLGEKLVPEFNIYIEDGTRSCKAASVPILS